MKKTYPFYSMLALASLLYFSSCSKKSDPAPPRDQLLSTAKGWKLTDVTVTVSGITQSAISSIPACTLDNIIYFKSTGAYLEDEGATKCNSSDPQTAGNGTWKFNTDKTVITVTLSSPTNPSTDALTVVSMTATTLVVKESFNVNGVTGFATSTLTAL